MNWWGKVLGGAFGFMVGGPLGALLGAVFGHQVDSGLEQPHRLDDIQAIQAAFFTTLFSTLGHLAKADGRVSEAEVASAERLMQGMQLNNAQRRTAIRLFGQGKSPHFDLEEVVGQFNGLAGRETNLKRLLVELLLDGALADGAITDPERQVIHRVCAELGITPAELRQLESMRRQGVPRPAHTGGPNPYDVLGVPREASVADIKRAYRRLMSRHHPDKLVSKGLPEEMMQVAKARVREIRAAYDRIREERGF